MGADSLCPGKFGPSDFGLSNYDEINYKKMINNTA